MVFIRWRQCPPPPNTWFLGPTRDLNPNGISIASADFAQRTTECPYTLQWAALSDSKLPLLIGGSGPPSNTWFLGPIQVLNPNGISIDSEVFAGLTTVTDRQTNRPHKSVCDSRPHLHSQYSDAA